MTIEPIGSLEGLQRLRPEWLALHRECPGATPFQSPEWLLPWTTHLFGGGEIQALAMREQHRLVGFAPLFCWGGGQRTVSFLGAGVSDYGDILFAPGVEHECITALWRFLDDRTHRWDCLDLQELRAGSGLLDGFAVVPCSVCPVLDLKTFPGAMDPKLRTDLRRARNKLQRSELGFEMADQTNFVACMRDFFHLYQSRWGRPDLAFHLFLEEAAVAFLAAGLLRLAVLRVDGAAAAAIYAFADDDTLYCYLSGFDPAAAKLSPGGALLGWLLEQAVCEGLREVDFLRHPEAYKYLWGAKDRVNYTLRLESSSRRRFISPGIARDV